MPLMKSMTSSRVGSPACASVQQRVGERSWSCSTAVAGVPSGSVPLEVRVDDAARRSAGIKLRCAARVDGRAVDGGRPEALRVRRRRSRWPGRSPACRCASTIVASLGAEAVFLQVARPVRAARRAEHADEQVAQVLRAVERVDGDGRRRERRVLGENRRHDVRAARSQASPCRRPCSTGRRRARPCRARTGRSIVKPTV